MHGMLWNFSVSHATRIYQRYQNCLKFDETEFPIKIEKTTTSAAAQGTDFGFHQTTFDGEEVKSQNFI